MNNVAKVVVDHVGDVRAFIRVAEAGSFTIAAERMGLSRSAIGKCVARLEEGLASRLLQRTTRHVSLTEEGRIFYDCALRIVAEVEEAEEALQKHRQAPRGRLRVDVPVAFGRQHVLPLLQAFLNKWPDLAVDVTFSDDYVDVVREGVDVAIRIGGNDDSRLVRRVLAPHRLVTCASPAYLEKHGTPRAPADLAHHRTRVFLHGGRAVPWRYRIDGVDRDVLLGGKVRLGDTAALRDAALAGHGLVQLGAFLVGAHLRRGELVPVLGPYGREEPPICAVYPSRRHVPPKVRVFLDELTAHWRDAAPWD